MDCRQDFYKSKLQEFKDSCFPGEDYNGTSVMDAKRKGLPGRLCGLLTWKRRSSATQPTIPRHHDRQTVRLNREDQNMKHYSALTRSTQAIGQPGKTGDKQALSDTISTPRRVLWIDGIGGFLCCDTDEVVIGQAVGGSLADIGIVGDLSRQAAAIRRSGGDYLLQPLQQMWLNDAPVERAQLLRDGSVLQLGRRVRVGFAKPNPLSATARLNLLSLNKWKPSVDGVLLLADSCVIGPNPGSHIHCPLWKNELLMFRHADGWYFRTLAEVEVNGQKTQGQIPIVSGMRIRGEDFSLSVE